MARAGMGWERLAPHFPKRAAAGSGAFRCVNAMAFLAVPVP
jgi:hypothetical protein